MSAKTKNAKQSSCARDAKRDAMVRLPKNNRTKMANGRALFIDGVQVDGRTGLARRYREHVADLAEQAGADPTPAQRILIRNAATIAVQLEIDQAKVADGQAIDDELYLKRVASMVTILRQLGIKREGKNGSTAKVIDGHTAALLEAN
ncbi:MAG: hypothetical protein JSR99_08375 [Proteobacteria bacterium]|nr:hypothetical protein [Pseudomonadota bacterium]